MAPAYAMPPGKAMGCLPRRTLPGQLCGFAADHIPILSDDQIEEWAGKVSLRHLVPVILDQDGVGSCATESSTQSVMLARSGSGLPFELLNPWFVYHTTSGGRDNGSSIDENLAFIRKYGVAPESVWPRSKGWRASPSEEARAKALDYRIDEFYEVRSAQEVKSCLVQGYAVVYGAKGHSVIKVEYLGRGKSTDVNSWGRDWGEQGFGEWASIERINWSYGAFAVRSTLVPDSPIAPTRA